MKLRPRNWVDFQHYKDRSPPWIRLHRSLLDNPDFHALSPLAAKTLVMFWLLAAETVEGDVNPDHEYLAFRLRMPRAQIDEVMPQLRAARFIVEVSSEHAQPERGKTPAQLLRDQNGYGSRHISDKTKRAVWERDCGACAHCGSKENIEFDHIHPVSKGGNSEPENVQLLCRTCNRRKRAKTAEQVATHAQPWLELRTSETETETETEKTIAPDGAVGDADDKPKKSDRLTAVTEQAIEAFNSSLSVKSGGLLSAVTLCTDKRKAQVKRTVKLAAMACERLYGSPTVTPEFWQQYFEEVQRDDFKSGRGPYTNGHANWRPDFEYLTRPEVVEKVIDDALSRVPA